MTTTQVRTEDDQALEIVRMGFGDCYPAWNDSDDRSLMFRVGFATIEKVCEAIESIGEYNDFDPDRVCEAMRKVAKVVNKRDLDCVRHYSVGREGSPVIYVHLWGNEGNVEDVIDALREAGPDELYAENDRRVRAWWD